MKVKKTVKDLHEKYDNFTQGRLKVEIEISLASIEFAACEDVQKTEAGMSEDKATEVHG